MANGDDQDPTDPGAALRAEMEDKLRREMEAAARRAKMFGTSLAGADASRALARNRPGASGDIQAATRNPLKQLANVAKEINVHALNAAQGVPILRPLIEGGEAALGAVGSHIGAKLGTGAKPMGYGEALQALREDISDIPAGLRAAEQLAFSIPAGRVVPLPAGLTSGGGVLKSAAKGGLVGGGIGAIEALLDPNLDLSAGERIGNAAEAFGPGSIFGAALGGAGAKLDQMRRVRAGAAPQTHGEYRQAVANAPNVNQALVDRDLAIKGTTRDIYSGLRQEAAAAAARPTTGAMLNAFEDETVAPYIADLRASRKFRRADDATLAIEADSRMTAQRRAYNKYLKNPARDPKDVSTITTRRDDIIIGQQNLRDAMARSGIDVTILPPLEPSRLVPPMETAQSPAPTTREAIDAFHRRIGQSVTRKEGTVAQQSARQSLERHHAENVVSPPLRGEPGTEPIFVPGSGLRVSAEEIPPMLPSHENVVTAKKQMEDVRRAAIEGSEMGNRAATGARVDPKQATVKSLESFRQRLDAGEYTPEQAQAALDTFLGELKRTPFQQTPVSRFFVGGSGAGAGAAVGGAFGGPVGAVAGGLAGPFAANLARRGALSRARFEEVRPTLDALFRAAGHPVRGPLSLEGYMRLLMQAQPVTRAVGGR